MAKQTLMWTALPNGIDPETGGVRVSVVLSPRLEPAGDPQQLDTFPDFMDPANGRCWIDTVLDAVFTFTYGSKSVTVTAAALDERIGRPHADTWRAMFRDTTLVRDHAFSDRTGTRVLSFDAVAAHRLLQDTWQQTAAGGDQLPSVPELLQQPTIASLVTEVRRLDGREKDPLDERIIEDRMDRYIKNDYPVNQPTQRLLQTFSLFHTPPSKPETQTYTADEANDHDPLLADATWRTHARAELPTAETLAKKFDFHEITTAMQQYPTLLRRLGLVLDFILPRGAVARAADALLSVSVALPGTSPVGRKAITARVHAQLTRDVFQPVPTPNGNAAQRYQIVDGLLRPDERLFVLQVDVDAGMHKMLNFARTLGRKATDVEPYDPATRMPVTAGLPALRNAGLSLVHRGRGEALEKTFARSKALNTTATSAAGAPELWWEDVVMGFRTDAWDRTTGRWRSLCERVSQYILDGGAVTVNDVREEGTIRMAATSAADGSRPKLVSLHETIITWAGWSLAARAPTRSVDKNDSPGPAEAKIPDGMPLETQFVAAPGSLPRLRYGRSYALRARAVDLAGNSLPPNPADFGDERPEDRARPYLRFQPVGAPNLALLRIDGAVELFREGESMDHLAIRSLNDTFDDPTPSDEFARRIAVPQRTDVREAELHGMLDANGRMDPSTYGVLVAQDKDLEATVVTLSGPMSDPADATYAVLDRGAPLPYLPDPMSEVIAARFLYHPKISPLTVVDIPLYPAGAWPTAVPFEIEVYESDVDAPAYDPDRHTLRVPLPKAGRTIMRLSSQLSADSLRKLGVWEWLAQPGLASKARQGRLWALTPWRDVEIVHATQRPLLRPDILELRVDRQPGDTFVKPVVRSRCSIASTARVDLRAEWHEPRDDALDGGIDLKKTDTATTIKITDPTRYAGSHDMTPGLPVAGAADHAITGKDEIQIGMAKRNAPVRVHEFGDTRYRRIEYWYDATTRFREYLKHGLLTVPGAPGEPDVPTEAKISLSGAVTRSWIPNSGTPPAPKVLYMVPTFEWVRTTDANGKQSSMRRGGGVRVYLDRPWNETGYGEMLAVVLLPSTSALDANSEAYKTLVTQWGNDPAWKSPFVAGQAPARTAFPLRRDAADPTGAWLPPFAPPTEADQPAGPFPVTGLRTPPTPAIPATAISAAVPAKPGQLVDIAPHDVFYDAERQLWYCDIELSPAQSYMPFVRLALARYQPVSVAGCHLSNVVIADFMALTPTRWLSVTPGSVPSQQVVSVYGYTHTENAGWRENFAQRMSVRNPITGEVRIVVPSGISQKNVIELWLEELQPDLGEDLGWQRVPTTATPAGTGVMPMPPGGLVQRRLTQREQRRFSMLTDQRQFTTLLTEGLLERAFMVDPLWRGTVLPSNGRTPGRRQRLVIAEFEEYLVDDTDPYNAPHSAKDRRMVFVEHIELP